MQKIFFILILSTSFFCVGVSGAKEIDWWKSQRDLSGMLLEKDADITKLVSEMSSKTPANGQEAMMKVCVMIRSGYREKTIDALRELKPFLSDNSSYQLSSIYYYVFDEMRDYKLAKSLMEIFADRFYEVSLENRLIKHFLKSGWSVDQVDEWLAKMPKGKRDFWYKERFRFNVVNGRGDAYVKKEFDAVKKNPDDIAAAILLLNSLCSSRSTGKEDWDLSWMPEVIQPKLSSQSEKLAGYLKSLKKWPESLSYYELARKTPVTKEEVVKRGMMFQMEMSEERLRIIYEVHIIEEIADLMLKMGKNKEAQEWMVKAADIRKEKKLGMNAFFAGQVQGGSQQRVIEERIKKEEKVSKDSPEYWNKRAQYYRGRKEADKEEEALLKALALTVPKEKPDKTYKGYRDKRGRTLNNYISFLMREKRLHEAEGLLRKEIKEAPPKSDSSITAVIRLRSNFKKNISVDDELLWLWLSAQPKLGYAGQRLLRQMLENAEKKDLKQHFDRAEKLIGTNVDDLYELGWVMNRLGFPERSISLLKIAEAKERKEENQHRGRAAFALFESYLDIGDWKAAENLFPEASRRLTAGELPKWYGKVAVKAAKAGAKKDAMRIWKKVANVAPYNEDGLDDLVKAGLKDELKKFYLQMQKKMPDSDMPAKIIVVLEEM